MDSHSGARLQDSLLSWCFEEHFSRQWLEKEATSKQIGREDRESHLKSVVAEDKIEKSNVKLSKGFEGKK